MSETHGMDADQWKNLTDQQQRTVEGAYAALRGAGVEAVGGFRVAAPEFKPGDVIVVKYIGDACRYAYLRQPVAEWHAFDGGLLFDPDVSQKIAADKATLILRDGQLTDDGARMAGERLVDSLPERLSGHDVCVQYGGSYPEVFRAGFDLARRMLRGEVTPFAEAGE